MTTYVQHAKLNRTRDYNELPPLSDANVMHIGRRLGFFDALESLGSLTADELATVTATTASYAGEWLERAAASRYIRQAPGFQRFYLQQPTRPQPGARLIGTRMIGKFV